MSRPPTEILVHIAASSRATDDVGYRTLASAYLDFQLSRRTTIFGADELTSEAADGINPPGNTAQHISTQYSSFQYTSFRSTRGLELSSFNSPDISFQSVENNLDSPRLQQLPEQIRPTQQSHLSWQAPPSEVPDSYPESNLPLPNFSTPTRILERFISTLDSSQSDQSPLLYRKVDQQRVELGESQPTSEFSHYSKSPGGLRHDNDHESTRSPSSLLAPSSPCPRSDVQATQHTTCSEVVQHETSSPAQSRAREVHEAATIFSSQPALDDDEQLPSKPATERLPLTDDGQLMVIPQSPVLTRKRPRPTPQTPGIGDVTHITASFPDQQDQPPPPGKTIPSFRAESEPPPKRLRQTPQDPDPGKPLARSSSDIGPCTQHKRETNKRYRVQTPPDPTGVAKYMPRLELFSPPPRVGVHDVQPDDMVTDALSNLALGLNLKKRFRPESQTREVRPFERGYWQVDCRTWDAELKQACWVFLGEYLSKGLVGWGVWCDRDAEFSSMRLWCFGQVMGHLYLILYLASQREVLTTGLSWIGGDGKAVVVMGAKKF